MGLFRTIKVWVMDLLLISDLDRKAEREFRKMRQLYKKGGLINKYRSRRIENILRIKYRMSIPCSAKIGKNFQILFIVIAFGNIGNNLAYPSQGICDPAGKDIGNDTDEEQYQ